MKKKLTLIATAVALGALVVVGATMAYFTSQDTATNTVSTGGIQVIIKEKGALNDDFITVGKDETEKGLDLGKGVVPNADLEKQVKFVIPESSQDAYIRAAVTFEYKKAGETYTMPADKKIVIDGLGTGWSLNEDGYYYFDKSVAPEGETSELFTNIHIPATWNNEQSGVTVTIKVDVQAVQSANMDVDPVKAFAAAADDLVAPTTEAETPTEAPTV